MPKNFGRCFGQDIFKGEWKQRERESNLGLAIETQDWCQSKIAEGDISGGLAGEQSGTSIFDPVLCELVYRWFCPSGGSVLDPFAGGSVRGIVAAKCGLAYTGIDLRAEQVAANEEQAKAITPEWLPRWIVGDSTNVGTIAPGTYDLVFSCPPYADLERYSDDPADLSTMDYPTFLKTYRAIVAASVAMLRPNRFACFVVGDIRDGKGFYRSFVADTVAAFRDAGMELYNDAVLITQVGSLPIRVGKQFGSYRKLGKTHQNVLVFFKGDPKRIPDQFGEVDFTDPAEEFGDVVEAED
jgi:DNA modification methylase